MTADEWPKVRLQDVTSILGDGLHGTPKYDDQGEYYFINGGNLRDGKIVLNEKTKRTAEKEFLKHKKDLNDKTILVSINGTLGNVALYNGEKVFLGKSVCYFNVNEDVDKQFIRYLVSSHSFQNYIHTLATGTTIKNVSLKLMRDFTFYLPPLDVQKRISKVPKNLDDKIELNHEKNHTLYSLAQTIFKSWFIDFEPVKSKAKSRLPFGMDEETAVLFPNSFEDSPIGLIPKGWYVHTIDSLTSKFTTGLNPRKNFVLGKGENYYVTTKNLSRGYLKLDESCDKIDNRAMDVINQRSKLEKGDVLLSGIGTIGRTYYIDKKPKNWNISESIFTLRAKKNKTTSIILYYILLSHEFQSFCKNYALGSAQEGIRMSDIKKYRIALPDYSTQKVFSEPIEKLLCQSIINRKKIEDLIDVRDTLVNPLITGKLQWKVPA